MPFMSSERFIEATGDSVEDAIAKGLAELGVGPSDVVVEVLEEPSRGVFGLGARQAKVRLQLLVAKPAPAPKPVQSQPVSSIKPAPMPLPPPAPETVSDDDLEIAEGEQESYQDATVGKAVLIELLDKMSIRANVAIRRAAPEEQDDEDEETPWLLDVSGAELDSLIGKRGETLSSLQYITRLIASRELQRRANIIVDVSGYKSRRAKMLSQLAVRMAEQAIQQKRTVTLEPMPPYERRIVHLALRDHAHVYTRSVGEGESRKVTIVPK
jgi:spoIIIJ-associated protein